MISLENRKYSWYDCTLIEFINEGNLPSEWIDFFNKEEVLNELLKISYYLQEQIKIDYIYPPIHNVFKAFYKTSLKNIKAVIIAKDPYFNGTNEYNGSATGLCFSIRHGNRINPSLRNIYKELKSTGHKLTEDGDLTHWAENGILMINMALTVRKGLAGSHSKIWEKFSELLVKYISSSIETNWLLFGNDAIKIKDKILFGKTFCTSHPSPLGAMKSCKNYPPFLGSNIFSTLKNIMV